MESSKNGFASNVLHVARIGLLSILLLINPQEILLAQSLQIVPLGGSVGYQNGSVLRMELPVDLRFAHIPTKLAALVPIPERSMTPVQMFFSAHRTALDARWVISKMNGVIEKAGAAQPVVVWLEHAEPFTAPHSLQELQDRFPQINGQSINWYEEVMGNPASPQSLSRLRMIFEQAKRIEGDPVPYFLKTSEPFAAALRQGIAGFAKQGREVRIKAEEPCFEAYVNFLQHDGMRALTGHWLSQGKFLQAFASHVLAYDYLSESIRLRDESLTRQIDGAYRKNPRLMNLVVRGLAHHDPMAKLFHARGIRAYSALQRLGGVSSARDQWSEMHQYLLKYHHLPSPKSLDGFVFLVRQLFAH